MNMGCTFGIVPLGWEEWKIVLAWSAPIILIDEGLKFLERGFFMETTEGVEKKGELKKRGSKKVD